MKKNTMKSLVAYLNGQTITNLDEIRMELMNELAKDEAKAKANRDAYAEAHDVVMAVVDSEPKTVAEIFAACQTALPEGFSKGKVQYALSHYWNDEVVKVDNGKSPNTYRKA